MQAARFNYVIRKPVWFENGRGLISIGTGLFALMGRAPTLIEVVCHRTGKRFADVQVWENPAQYEQLKTRKKLNRNRGGSLSKSGDRR